MFEVLRGEFCWHLRSKHRGPKGRSRYSWAEGLPQRPQEEDVRLDRRLHTTEAQMFAWTRALRIKKIRGSTGHGQPNTPRPQGGMERNAGQRRSTIRWRSAYGFRRWNGFHEKPTTTSTSVQLNVLLGRKGTIGCESIEDTTSVRTVAHIVPDRVMPYDLLLGLQPPTSCRASLFQPPQKTFSLGIS